jgi:hypothetical protein
VKQGRTRQLAWLLTAGACGLTLAVGGLASGAKLKQKSETFDVPAASSSPTDGSAACKRGHEAVAGGFYADAESPSSVLLFDSLREGTRSWSLSQYQSSGGQATVYAYCDKQRPGLKERQVTEELTANFETQSVRAKCKRGKEAVSGGFEAPFTEMTVVASKRAGTRSWEAQFVGPMGLDVTAIVYCDKEEPGLKTKTKSTTLSESEEVAEAVTARCKRKQELRSGGFETEFSDPADTQGLPTGSRRDGKRGWEAAAASSDGSPELTAYAYCDKKERKR